MDQVKNAVELIQTGGLALVILVLGYVCRWQYLENRGFVAQARADAEGKLQVVREVVAGQATLIAKTTAVLEAVEESQAETRDLIREIRAERRAARPVGGL